METTENIITRTATNMRRVYEMSLSGTGNTSEADSLRRAIYDAWLSLDPHDRQRLQDEQCKFIKEQLSSAGNADDLTISPG
jgi:hypothetical protein